MKTTTMAKTCLLLAQLILSAACAQEAGGGGSGAGGGADDSDGDGDGSGGGGGDDGSGGGGGSATAFRLTDFDLRDPHVFIDALGCQDVTESPVNEGVESAIREDNGSPADPQQPDGLLDLNALLVFRPLVSGAGETGLQMLAGADCTAPMDSTSCTAGAAVVAELTAANDDSNACDVIVPDTLTGSYAPAPPVAQAPCFVTDATDGEFHLDPFVLEDYSLAAAYEGDPATGLVKGVLRGFMSEADAEAAIVTTPLGDQTVASLLAGGEGSCASGDARDTGPDGESGWYFYLEFTAETVDYTD